VVVAEQRNLAPQHLVGRHPVRFLDPLELVGAALEHHEAADVVQQRGEVGLLRRERTLRLNRRDRPRRRRDLDRVHPEPPMGVAARHEHAGHGEGRREIRALPRAQPQDGAGQVHDRSRRRARARVRESHDPQRERGVLACEFDHVVEVPVGRRVQAEHPGHDRGQQRHLLDAHRDLVHALSAYRRLFHRHPLSGGSGSGYPVPLVSPRPCTSFRRRSPAAMRSLLNRECVRPAPVRRNPDAEGTRTGSTRIARVGRQPACAPEIAMPKACLQ
jgi:hypothetical protein